MSESPALEKMRKICLNQSKRRVVQVLAELALACGADKIESSYAAFCVAYQYGRGVDQPDFRVHAGCADCDSLYKLAPRFIVEATTGRVAYHAARAVLADGISLTSNAVSGELAAEDLLGWEKVLEVIETVEKGWEQ